jgi:hypothetical protein
MMKRPAHFFDSTALLPPIDTLALVLYNEEKSVLLGGEKDDLEQRKIYRSLAF